MLQSALTNALMGDAEKVINEALEASHVAGAHVVVAQYDQGRDLAVLTISFTQQVDVPLGADVLESPDWKAAVHSAALDGGRKLRELIAQCIDAEIPSMEVAADGE